MLTTPQCSAHLVVQSQFLNTIVRLQLLNTMVGPQLLTIVVRPQLFTIMVRPQLFTIMVRPQLFTIMVRPQLLQTMVGTQLLQTMVGTQLLQTMVGTQLLNPMVGPQLQLSASMADNPTVSMAPSQLPTTCFSKSSISQHITSGHDVIHTPAPFRIWCLLWQLWLSYPLCASIKLYPMTVHLN